MSSITKCPKCSAYFDPKQQPPTRAIVRSVQHEQVSDGERKKDSGRRRVDVMIKCPDCSKDLRGWCVFTETDQGAKNFAAKIRKSIISDNAPDPAL